MDEAVEAVQRLPRGSLVGIDGLPCSGKSTLVERIERRADVACIYLDDFVRPEQDWPTRNRPAFPFEYMRYDEFLAAVRTLATEGQCAYCPYDWQAHSVVPEARTVTRERTVVVEGVSALHPELAPLYDLKVFIARPRRRRLGGGMAGALSAECRYLHGERSGEAGKSAGGGARGGHRLTRSVPQLQLVATCNHVCHSSRRKRGGLPCPTGGQIS